MADLALIAPVYRDAALIACHYVGVGLASRMAAENVTKLPVTREKSESLQAWRPFESLRQEIDRLFDDFGMGFWRPFPLRRSFWAAEPLHRRELTWTMPVVDVIESEKAYEITAELPGSA